MRLSPRVLRWFLLPIISYVSLGLRADSIDDTVVSVMAKRHVPGLSLAVIQNGKIVKAAAYGVMEIGRPELVTPDTLFQAGSVSKPVAALASLALVEKGQLSLDTDINEILKTWKVPENEYTHDSKVTLRRLLSHTAGLSVHGFPGYAVGETVPSLLQVLDGTAPANTPAIRVTMVPGTKWQYSGGGYTVLQQCILNVTGQSFPEFMRKTVLEPLHMSASSYEQPLPQNQIAQAATGHYKTKPVDGRWHVYPEMAAAGLWTTPSDLARFVIGIQDALAGRGNPVLSQALTREMLTAQKENGGLGFFLSGKDPNRQFGHDGRDEGFDTNLIGYLESGQGAVVMINTNDNSNVIRRVFDAIADTYHWLDYPRRENAKPIEDKEPKVTAQVKAVFEQARSSKLDLDLFIPSFGKRLEASLPMISEQIREFGALKNVELLGRRDVPRHLVYQYRFTYENDVVIVNCGYDPSGKIDGLLFQPE